MQFRLFIFAVLLFSQTSWGVSRKPAVEDFVGIEVDHPETTPQGAESLVNLEKDIQTIEASAYTVKSVPKKPTFMPETPAEPWSATNAAALVLLLGLPLFSWLTVMHRLKKRASLESASNVEVLERYRRERELARNREASEKKAS